MACWCGGAAAGGGTDGPTRLVFLFFVFEKNLRRELIGPLGAYPPRGVPPALGEDTFAGTAGSRGLRRELPLSEAFIKRKDPLGERNLALGEALRIR
jgi:hypothetical protein